VPWPWAAYREEEPADTGATPEIRQAYNHLARLLLWFRAGGYRDIARVDDLMERVAPGGTTTARNLLEFLVERGLINSSGKLYTLVDGVVASYGINYVDLRRRNLKQPVVNLLRDFVERKE
jgi:hypothetical protein